jgi:5S rRNA maturation endonuclease (ribonuclease M5)
MEIGAHSIISQRRSSFIYKLQSACQGYFIRKQNWLNALKEPEDVELEECIKSRMKHRYENIIENNMNTLKKQHLKELADKKKSKNVIILTENIFSPANKKKEAENKKI